MRLKHFFSEFSLLVHLSTLFFWILKDRKKTQSRKTVSFTQFTLLDDDITEVFLRILINLSTCPHFLSRLLRAQISKKTWNRKTASCIQSTYLDIWYLSTCPHYLYNFEGNKKQRKHEIARQLLRIVSPKILKGLTLSQLGGRGGDR